MSAQGLFQVEPVKWRDVPSVNFAKGNAARGEKYFKSAEDTDTQRCVRLLPSGMG
jgi:hypothetical protein